MGHDRQSSMETISRCRRLHRARSHREPNELEVQMAVMATNYYLCTIRDDRAALGSGKPCDCYAGIERHVLALVHKMPPQYRM